MRTESIWEQQANEAARPGFSGRKKIQTAVVGGGMAGILTALYLKEAGQDVMVLEAARIGSGQTGRTTAKVTAQHGACCGRLIRELGEEKAGLYAAANRRAVEEYRRLVREKKIDCGWRECAAFCYSTEDRERMQAEAQAERKLGFAAEFVTETELPFPVAGAVRMDGQACFSPLRFLYAIARGLEIYENTPVKKVERLENGNTLLHTPEGCVEAEKVVFATHYPMLKLPGIYFARLFQERSYVTALRGAGTVENMYIGTDENSWSVRSVKGKMGEEDLILLGGAGHRTGGNQGGRYEVLREAAGRFWKGSMETAHWSAQDCMKAVFVTAGLVYSDRIWQMGDESFDGGGAFADGSDHGQKKSLGRGVYAAAVWRCIGGSFVSKCRLFAKGAGRKAKAGEAKAGGGSFAAGRGAGQK